MLPVKQASKDVIMAACTAFSPTLNSGGSILMYHSVAYNKAFFTVTPEAFEKQLRYLLVKKYSIIFLSEFVRKMRNRESVTNTVVITFDDAYLDNYENVFRLLKKYKIPISLCVPTGILGKSFTNSEGITLPLMTEKELQEMHSSGLVEIIPHTHTHAVLTRVPLEKARKEIDQSIDECEKLSGKSPTVFAYPKGKYNEDILKYIQQKELKGAVSVSEGLVSMNDNLFTLKRNSIDSSTTYIQFKAKVSGGINLYNKLKRILKF